MKRFATLVCLIALLSSSLMRAQDFRPLAISQARMRSVISTFSQNTPEFTAVLSYQVFTTQGVPTTQLMSDIRMTKDDMRIDLLLMSMSQIPTEQRALMKSLRMDKLILQTSISEKKMYLAYPGIQAFQDFPITEETLNEITTRSQAASIQKKVLGQETVNGYQCMKTLVEVTESNRPPEKALVWFASDLHEFPVMFHMGKNGLLEVIEFKNVQLVSPNPALFKVPTNYIRLEDTAAAFRLAKERLASMGRPFAPPVGDGNVIPAEKQR